MHIRGIILTLLLLASISTDAQFVFGHYDIWPGAGSGAPLSLGVSNNKLFMTARDSIYGRMLWMTDGTPSGTKKVSNVSGAYFTAYKGKTYFSGNTLTYGTELWVTDGTDTGTKLVIDINSGPAGSTPMWLTVSNGLLYFSALTANEGRELWVSDGTASGTVLVKDIWIGTKSSDPISLIDYNGQLMCIAYNGSYSDIYVTDGTTAGTYNLGVQALAQNLFAYNGYVYFGASTPSSGIELWRTDGTVSGTQFFKDLWTGGGGSDPNSFIEANGKMFFQATSQLWAGYGETDELWISDGTPGGTQMVKDIWPGSRGSIIRYQPYPLPVAKNKVYFTATDSIHGPELWASDGTASGTYMVHDANKTPTYGGGIIFDESAAFGGKCFYAGARDNAKPYEDWVLRVSDGTDSGSYVIEPFSNPAKRPLYNGITVPFVVMGNKMFFPAMYDSSMGMELWWIEDTSMKNPPPPNNVATVSKVEFSIAPNPSQGIVNITLSQPVESGMITITDITGRKVLQQDIKKSDKNITLHLSNIPKGTYIVTLRHNDGIESKKLLLE